MEGEGCLFVLPTPGCPSSRVVENSRVLQKGSIFLFIVLATSSQTFLSLFLSLWSRSLPPVLPELWLFSPVAAAAASFCST